VATAAVLTAAASLAVLVRLVVAARILELSARDVWSVFQGTVLATGIMAGFVIAWQMAAADLPVLVRLAGSVLVGAFSYAMALMLVEGAEVRRLATTILAALRHGRGAEPMREPTP